MPTLYLTSLKSGPRPGDLLLRVVGDDKDLPLMLQAVVLIALLYEGKVPIEIINQCYLLKNSIETQRARVEWSTNNTNVSVFLVATKGMKRHYVDLVQAALSALAVGNGWMVIRGPTQS